MRSFIIIQGFENDRDMRRFSIQGPYYSAKIKSIYIYLEAFGDDVYDILKDIHCRYTRAAQTSNAHDTWEAFLPEHSRFCLV